MYVVAILLTAMAIQPFVSAPILASLLTVTFYALVAFLFVLSVGTLASLCLECLKVKSRHFVIALMALAACYAAMFGYEFAGVLGLNGSAAGCGLLLWLALHLHRKERPSAGVN
jgi:hypothetical protein